MILLILAAAAVAAAVAPPEAAAHCFPIATQPAVGCTVASPPGEIAIDFDGPIEALFARLEVLDAGGQPQTAGAPSVGDDRRRLSAPLKPLPPGDFTVKWSVTSRDGHRTQGTFSFTVAGAAQ